MLKLVDIKKDYLAGENQVHALKGVSLSFREQEFVSILGQSGCGKTTLLNIIGGLDQYTSGDLIINGVSTKKFKDRDWDTYRNHSIGFVFQSYNLIPHQTVLSNVELALTLSGVSKDERRQRAAEMLEKVGLGDQLNKKPNQLSGGQMQRVAIARALVNDPDILLADEPTGALDTETSVQIMELLKEVAKDKLVIMVTHNPELAVQYSTRIIKLLDGKIIDDSKPFNDDEVQGKDETGEKRKKTSMGFFTALSLSLNNLMTKKGRTILTAFAGSIGIIGIALILSISNGIQTYINSVEEDTLSAYPITIQEEVVDMSTILKMMMGQDEEDEHELDKIYAKNMLGKAMQTLVAEAKSNNMKDFKTFLDSSSDIKSVTNAIKYSYNVNPYVYLDDAENPLQVNPFDISGSGFAMDSNSPLSSLMSNSSTSNNTWVEMIDNKELLNQQYEVISGKWPSGDSEAVLVVNDENEVYDLTLYAMGIKDASDMYSMFYKAISSLGDKDFADEIDSEQVVLDYDEIINKSFRLVIPSDLFEYDEETGKYVDMRNNKAYISELLPKAKQVKIVGIIRVREDAVSTSMQPGSIAYTRELTESYIKAIKESELVKKQQETPDTDIFSGLPFETENKKQYTTEEKVTLFTEYIAGLTTAEKASLFKKIYSTPSEEQLKSMSQEYLDAYKTREERQEFLINSLVQAVGKIRSGEIDSSGILPNIQGMPLTEDSINQMLALSDEELIGLIKQSYAQYSDKEFNDMYEQMLPQFVGLMYMLDPARSFDTYTNEQLADLMDNYLPSQKAEVVASLFDKYMPSMYSSSTYDDNMTALGYCELDTPSMISLYAKSFDDKKKLMKLIDEYNEKQEEADQITYTDYVGIMMSSISNIVNMVSYVLIAFVSISLVVSSIMIGIITYISVLERTKEIGILRAIGASKRDIKRVFNSESITIGFISGFLGILITLLLNIPICKIIKGLTDVDGIAKLPIFGGVALVLISMFLTFIAGMIPSRLAAKKDPVIALRTE